MKKQIIIALVLFILLTTINFQQETYGERGSYVSIKYQDILSINGLDNKNQPLTTGLND